MKKFLFAVLFVPTVLLLGNCSKKVEDPLSGITNRPNFMDLLSLNEIECRFFADDGYVLVTPAAEGLSRLDDEEEERLLAKYDDTHYNKGCYPGIHITFSNEFTAIGVVSDTDFNGIAPGEDLGGKIRLVAVSPYRWLKSKGTMTYSWSDSRPDDYGRIGLYASYAPDIETFPVNGCLTDLTTEDLRLLMAQYIYLYFVEKPSEKVHNLTVLFHEDGKTIVGKVEAVFQ